MKDILDPANSWLGTPGRALAAGNKRPVALDDTLVVQKDGAPVAVAVLANDFDPESQPLTLLSAEAALGTAVAETDNTVTYTPPPGISGFDTVIYTIADDLGQTRSAQINVTIIEPQLSIATQPNNTFIVTASTGVADITVTDPAEFSGTYQADLADLTGGPINLAVPAILGTTAEGDVLSATGGLWIYDVAGAPVSQSWQWHRDGADIAGATAASYTVQAADVGLPISVTETQTDSFGQRGAESPAVGSFSPLGDVQLIAWFDASDISTITETTGSVSAWADKAGPVVLTPSGLSPVTGSRSLNGQNVIDFGGSTYLAGPLSLPASGDVAFHMALELDSISNIFQALLAVDATNDFQIDANNDLQFDGRLNATGIGSSVNLSGGPFSGPMIVSVVFDRTGAATADVFIGNVLRASTPYSAAIDATTTLHVMTNRSKNTWTDGAVAEVIVSGDTSNRAQYHAYLASKWGIS